MRVLGAQRKKYGGENIVATGRKRPPAVLKEGGPYLQLDVLDTNQLHAMLVDYNINVVIHNASLLSGYKPGSSHSFPYPLFIAVDSVLITGMFEF